MARPERVDGAAVARPADTGSAGHVQPPGLTARLPECDRHDVLRAWCEQPPGGAEDG